MPALWKATPDPEPILSVLGLNVAQPKKKRRPKTASEDEREDERELL